MRILSFLATVLLTFLVTPAQAIDLTPGPVETAFVKGIGALPYQQLFQAHSREGEDVNAFMARVGPALRQWSDETGFEACGAIATDGQNLGITVGTSLSHLGCVIYSVKVPEGMRATGEGIHSHGGQGRFQMNKSDRLLRGVPEDARSQRMHGTVYGQALDAFSELDKHGAAGYLATPTGLLYHDGRGQVRVVR